MSAKKYRRSLGPRPSTPCRKKTSQSLCTRKSQSNQLPHLSRSRPRLLERHRPLTDRRVRLCHWQRLPKHHRPYFKHTYTSGHGGPATTGAGSLAAARMVTVHFSTLGILSVGTLLVTGTINTWYLAGSVPALTDTDYGRLLLIKVALFLGMVAIAAVNRLRLTPRLIAAASPRAMRAALRQLRRNVAIEIPILFTNELIGWFGLSPKCCNASSTSNRSCRQRKHSTSLIAAKTAAKPTSLRKDGGQAVTPPSHRGLKLTLCRYRLATSSSPSRSVQSSTA